MGPTQKFLSVNGTELFVDDRGPRDAPPLLYIHGGPGQSCYDFVHVQGNRLSERIRLIGLDQRGVLRSAPHLASESLDVETLVADFEGVRTALGIDSWAILGHSAGGGYAIHYAHAHPDRVRAAVYDCPCWDCDHTDRYRLPVAADLLDQYGKPEAAAAARELAARAGRLSADDQVWLVMQELGEHYDELFFRDPSNAEAFGRIAAESGFTDEDWSRGMSHLPLLTDMYTSKLTLLPGLSQPSLLVHGRYDLVTPPAHVQAFSEEVTNGFVHTFERSGHFPFAEEPEEYAAVVGDFVAAHYGLTA